jgi:hypothetical protein
MINCPHCGASNREESIFCGNCGEPLGAASKGMCPMCGTDNPPESTVCRQCGARLVPLTVPPSEEELEIVEEEAPPAEAVEEEEAVAEPEEVAEAEAIEEVTVVPEGELERPMPPWLRKLREGPAEELPADEKEGTRLAPAELPDWLETPPEFEEMLSTEAPAVDGEEIARAEIPSWLEGLRPGEEVVTAPEEAGGPMEVTGLLKGIRGVLGIEPVLAIPRRAKPLSPFSLSATEVERARTFERVVGEPARAKAEIAPPRRVEAVARVALRWLIYLIIFIAVAVPILLGSSWAAVNMRVSGPTIAMYDAIEALDPGSVVLISHDYGPGVAAEMIPQAKAVLHHLMQGEARLIFVSLTPEGSHLAQQVVEEVAEAHEGYAYGEGYLNLGYVVGAAVGPRSIVEGFPSPGWTDFVEHRPFSEFPLARDVGSIEDIRLIVELAGGAESLRLWLEQIQGPYQIPMVAGVSAAVDPFARPYYHNQARQQLRGLMIGLVGAAEYERHSGQPGSALASMDSQSLVHIIIVLLVLFGNVAYFSGRLRKG